MNNWSESSVKINHVGMTSLKEGDTYDKLDNDQKPGVDEATIENKPPWIVGPTDDTKKYEEHREKQILNQRQNLTYQFVMLLCGFTNEKLSKYWNREDEKPNKFNQGASISLAGDETVTNRDNNKQKTFHNWYVSTSWADGLVYLTPTVYGHIEEAFTAITQKYNHLADAKLEMFIESPRVRTMFARVVAMCIRISDVLSGKRYHMDRTYRRVNMERARLMNYFKHVHIMDDKLIYHRNDTSNRIATVGFKIPRGLEFSSRLLHLNNKAKYLN